MYVCRKYLIDCVVQLLDSEYYTIVISGLPCLTETCIHHDLKTKATLANCEPLWIIVTLWDTLNYYIHNTSSRCSCDSSTCPLIIIVFIIIKNVYSVLSRAWPDHKQDQFSDYIWTHLDSSSCLQNLQNPPKTVGNYWNIWTKSHPVNVVQ